MLSSVWSSLVSGRQSRQGQQTSQTIAESAEAIPPPTVSVEQRQDASEAECVREALTHSLGRSCSCTDTSCICTGNNCSCSIDSCACFCSLRRPKHHPNLGRVALTFELTLTEPDQHPLPQQNEGMHGVVYDHSVPSAPIARNTPPEVTEAVSESAGAHAPDAGRSEVHVHHSDITAVSQVLLSETPGQKQKERSEVLPASTHQEQQPPLHGHFPHSVDENGEAGFHRNSSEHPEGWEHITSDHLAQTRTGGVTALSAGHQAEACSTVETEVVPLPTHEGRIRSTKAKGTGGWTSPQTEFEYLAEVPLSDSRRVVRLSQRQQLTGWGSPGTGLSAASEEDSSSSSSAAGANVSTATVAEGRTSSKGSALFQLLRAAMLSSPLTRRVAPPPQGSADETTWPHNNGSLPLTGGGPPVEASGAARVMSGWCGRWQLTSIDSPSGSLSSYCSGDRRQGLTSGAANSSWGPVSGAPSGCRGGAAPLSRSHTRSAQPLMRYGTAVAAAAGGGWSAAASLQADTGGGFNAMEGCDLRFRSSSSAPSALGAGEEREARMDARDVTVEFDSVDEASCAATEFSDPAESRYSDETASRRLQDLLLHRAQRHLQRQCRRRLQRKDWRLNIMVAALPGIDTMPFCKQMFAAWHQVRRQQVSCGEEWVYRLPSAAPFVEVRLLEKWGADTAAQHKTSERRIHVCLFLIPPSEVPLPLGVLALLRRLRAVACLLPLLAVQQPMSADQLARARGTLRLQLANSDLATLEEMLLPVPTTKDASQVVDSCCHCQQQQTQQHEQLLQQHQKPEQAQQQGVLYTVWEGSGIEKAASNNKPANPHPKFRPSSGDTSSRTSSRNSLSSNPDRATRDELEGSAAGAAKEHGRSTRFIQRSSRRSSSYGDAALCRSAVHLPLVLQLPPCSTSEVAGPVCSCSPANKAGSSGSTGGAAVATPSSLRLMLVEASAMLLRERAEYGCFLPFLFKHQLQPNQQRKLRGLKHWEEIEEEQKHQQQHVHSLVEMRQRQIDQSVQDSTKERLQTQLNELRQQLQIMQHQLLRLQQKTFLQKLLREEEKTEPLLNNHRNLLVPSGPIIETSNREELMSNVAQMGLVFALTVGVGALLFTSIRRSSH